MWLLPHRQVTLVNHANYMYVATRGGIINLLFESDRAHIVTRLRQPVASC